MTVTHTVGEHTMWIGILFGLLVLMSVFSLIGYHLIIKWIEAATDAIEKLQARVDKLEEKRDRKDIL